MTPGSPASNADVPAIDVDLPAIHASVLAWYVANGRRLAFRATSDPWAILVSEAMAQQTQAERAAEAWTRFMTEFPTLEALAEATPAAVLRAWRGLGYNRRALALREAARHIVRDHGGRVPEDVTALRSLPGVGPYTARAVAALAFGQRQAAVDTNVARVLARALGPMGDEQPIDRAALQRLADSVVPATDPGAWTHALMDIGATRCRIRAPRCEECPLRPWCRFARSREIGDRPARARSGQTQRFPATTRWLRGRILDRLRDAPEGGWLTIEGPIGSHDGAAVLAAVEALAVERLLEVRGTEASVEARLPVA